MGKEKREKMLVLKQKTNPEAENLKSTETFDSSFVESSTKTVYV